MDNCRSPSRALRPMSLHFGAMSTDESVYISRRGNLKFSVLYLFSQKRKSDASSTLKWKNVIAKTHLNAKSWTALLTSSENDLVGLFSVADTTLEIPLLDSIGTLLEHAMTFINEHPTPETSPWKKKEKPSTPERRTPSPTSEPVSPITVIKGSSRLKSRHLRVLHFLHRSLPNLSFSPSAFRFRPESISTPPVVPKAK